MPNGTLRVARSGCLGLVVHDAGYEFANFLRAGKGFHAMIGGRNCTYTVICSLRKRKPLTGLLLVPTQYSTVNLLIAIDYKE